MKKLKHLTIVLLFFFISLPVKGQSDEIRITLSFENMPLKEAVGKIEDAAKVTFIYDANKTDLTQKVSLKAQNILLSDALVAMLKPTDLSFEVIKSSVVLFPRQAAATTSVQTVSQVKGRVIDQNGEPLAGVTIWIKDSSIGTASGFNGEYTINLGDNAYPVIVASFLGYEAQEELIGNRIVINFQMKPLAEAIEEVVVVGYGVQRKESVVGAISTLKGDQIKLPVGNLSTVIAGQLAGVVTVQRTGEPGSSAEFWIRGVSTTVGAANKPLVLVDGIERNMDLVDVEDISSFSVLKDATATAIYGVRGANGVILITTRQGSDGPPKINIRAETGITQPTRLPELANAEQFMRMYNEVAGYTKFSEETIMKHVNKVDPDLYPDVNWIDELYKKIAQNHRVNANVSGGGQIARYYISGSFYNEGSIYKTDNMNDYNTSIQYNKFNFRSNVDINISPTTVLQVSLANIYETKVSPNGDKSTLWQRSFYTSPNIFPTKYSDGTYVSHPSGTSNPYNLLTKNGFQNEVTNTSQALLGATQNLGMVTKGLKANVKFSWDSRGYAQTIYQGQANTFFATGRDEFGNLEYTEVNKGQTELNVSSYHKTTKTFYLEGSLTYDRTFGDHQVGAMFLYNQKSSRDYFNQNVGANKDLTVPYRNQGIAGRVTYSYGNRYFLEGNFGYNGSENFSPGNMFGFFPSAALGWVVSEENFFAGMRNTVTLLKFRASYGKVGNDKINDNVRFIYETKFGSTSNVYTFGNSSTSNKTGAYLLREGNPSVSWEESEKLDVGLELTLWNSVRFQADYFRDHRRGIFLSREDIADIAGIANLPYVNIGEVLNRGVDLQFEADRRFNKLNVSLRGNLTFNRNKILKNAQPEQAYPYMSNIGLPVGQQTGYVALGLFQSQEEIDNSPAQFGLLQVGDLKYKDVNGDKVINSYDQVPIGRTWLPEITYGFGASFEWRNFDLSFLFQGSAHTTLMLSGASLQLFTNDNENQGGFYADVYRNMWTESNPDPNAVYPRGSMGKSNNNHISSTYWQRDMSYLRLKNATIGYKIPTKLTGKIKIRQIHVYCSGVNLFTFSKFKLFDPEIDQAQGAKYPPLRIVSLGLNINF